MVFRRLLGRRARGAREHDDRPAEPAAAVDDCRATHRLVHPREDTRFHRETLLQGFGQEGLCLEIGPYFHPVAFGENVRYFDVFDTDELLRRAAADPDPTVTPDTVPRMHYWDDNADLSVIRDRFVEAVSSHCIEHQPDFIEHLEKVHDLLEPGGRYVVMVPDKRFCFDHFIPLSTVGDILEAHRERRTRHTLSAVVDHYAYHTHNNPVRHWEGDHADEGHAAGFDERLRRGLGVFEQAEGAYVDVHAWYFTPDSFAHICESLFQAGHIRLKLEAMGDTRVHELEFSAIFRRA